MQNLNKTEKTFFGQPRGLLTLFQTEFWERFSYYGMRAILVYYLYALTTADNAGLGLPKAQAMAIVSIYGALVYLSTIVGGWVADRLLGDRAASEKGGKGAVCGRLLRRVHLPEYGGEENRAGACDEGFERADDNYCTCGVQ